jgi:hypothetical protein
MIMFLFYAIFFTSMTFAVFGGSGNKMLFLFIMLSFIINQIVTMLYGISTSQTGFILLPVFQFFLVMLTYFYLSGNAPVWDEDED